MGEGAAADAENSEESKASRRQEVIGALAKDFIERAAVKAQQGPLQQLVQNLPTTSSEIRKLPFYNVALRNIEYQRDQYLVGSIHAERRRLEKEDYLAPPPFLKGIPFDSTSLGHAQISQLGANFIPSPTVKDSLLPIVVALPNGALKPSIVDSVVNAVPMAQPIVDGAVKSSMLSFVQSAYWREVIKKRTNTFIGSKK
jgi:hypothetical protein